MKSCPICNSEKTDTTFKSTQDFITSHKFELRKCLECEVSYTDPWPENLDNYYPSNYRGYNVLLKKILKIFYAVRVNSWLRRFKKPGKVLEIGCGPGYMLDIFRKKGWQVLGTERSKSMALHAREVLGLDVHIGDVASIPDRREFDLIVIFNVLEHIADPISMLSECSRRLKHEGTLIINVPNLDSWQARYAGPLWSHLDPPRHLFHFTPKSLEAVLFKSGLKMNGIKYSSPEFDSFGWLQSSINKLTGHYNLFALYLMGLEPLSGKVILSIVLSFFLTIPSILLSFVSWAKGSGALMQVSAEPNLA